jgi:hypothetical protein
LRQSGLQSLFLRHAPQASKGRKPSKYAACRYYAPDVFSAAALKWAELPGLFPAGGFSIRDDSCVSSLPVCFFSD